MSVSPDFQLVFQTFKAVVRFLFKDEFFCGAEISIDAWCSSCDFLVGLTKPRPPSCTGKARSSWSKSDGGALPVRAGINRSLMESSRGL